jgi:hypothetical protein
MRGILHLVIVTAALIVSFIGTNLVPVPKALKATAKECPFELNMEKVPVMVVRVIDNSSLPKEFAKRCFMNQLNNKEGIVIVNRENEPHILKELVHQSEIPVDERSVQPIGEILVPSHLYVINQRNNWVEVSLSEIKSGIYIVREEFEFNPLLEKAKENAGLIFKVILYCLMLTVLIFVAYILTAPIFNLLKRQEQIASINHNFSMAQEHLRKNNINEASRLLVQCAQSQFDCKGKIEAIHILKGLAKQFGGAA